jgi:anti-anti-sigma regulatory factor
MTLEPHIVALPSILDMGTAIGLHKTMIEHVDHDSDSILTIDASDVQRISTPILQLLLATHKSLTGKKRALALKNPSESIIEACQLLGLNDMLTVWRHHYDENCTHRG